jgi:hypothetical protein
MGWAIAGLLVLMTAAGVMWRVWICDHAVCGPDPDEAARLDRLQRDFDARRAYRREDQ